VCGVELVNLTAFARNSGMQDMSAEVVDSNPYSRLMALQRMGVVDNYEQIRDYSVAIVVSAFLNLS
jgi:ubiquitin-like modifier-activating enzyme 5